MIQRLTIVLLAGVFISSCQRSPQFRKEEAEGRYDVGSNYSLGSKPVDPRTPVQRVEAMGQPKKRVMVLNFWNDTPVKQNNVGNYAADELRRGLHLTQRVIVPTDVKTDLGTESFVQGADVKVAQLIREGRRMGVSVLVIGRITKIVFRQRGDEVGVFRQKQSFAAVETEAKVFDVMNGREIMATSRTGEASNNAVVTLDAKDMENPNFRAELTSYAIREAVAGLVPDVLKAIEKMTWQGRIAKITGPKIYINAGQESGLIVGDILRVLNPGDDIYDPATGAFLGRAQGHLKGTLEIVDFIGADGAVTEIHTGGNMKEGDLVQLY